MSHHIHHDPAVRALVAREVAAERERIAREHREVFEAWQRAEYEAHHEVCKARAETLRQKWQGAEQECRDLRALLADAEPTPTPEAATAEDVAEEEVARPGTRWGFDPQGMTSVLLSTPDGKPLVTRSPSALTRKADQ